MKFIFATGGSGGHLFPAIEVAEELRSRGHTIVFVGSLAGQMRILMKRRFEYILLNTKGFTLPQFINAGWLMIQAFLKSFSILRAEEPNAVIGFGGHGSFAIVLAAIFKRIPTMIHEQNVTPGRANRCLSKFVKRVAISFANSKEYFNPDKTTLTGCPTHLKETKRKRGEIFKEFGLQKHKKTILVFGGSQGAQRINEVFLNAAWIMKDKLDFQVIHISGQKDYQKVKRRYEINEVDACVYPFLDAMADAYSISDLVISRAGAVTVKELALFKKKAILIPYPYAKNHQRENALVLAKINVIKIIDEEDLSPPKLMQTIFDLLQEEKSVHHKMSLIMDSSSRLADLALTLG